MARRNRLTIVFSGEERAVLIDAALRALKPKEKDFKVADSDRMYVHVTTKGAMSFRMDYGLNGRRETLHLDNMVLTEFHSRAGKKCTDARRSIAEGVSSAIEKYREKRGFKEAKSFGEFGEIENP